MTKSITPLKRKKKILALVDEGLHQAEIARRLKVHASTISRFLAKEREAADLARSEPAPEPELEHGFAPDMYHERTTRVDLGGLEETFGVSGDLEGTPDGPLQEGTPDVPYEGPLRVREPEKVVKHIVVEGYPPPSPPRSGPRHWLPWLEDQEEGSSGSGIVVDRSQVCGCVDKYRLDYGPDPACRVCRGTGDLSVSVVMTVMQP